MYVHELYFGYSDGRYTRHIQPKRILFSAPWSGQQKKLIDGLCRSRYRTALHLPLFWRLRICLLLWSSFFLVVGAERVGSWRKAILFHLCFVSIIISLVVGWLVGWFLCPAIGCCCIVWRKVFQWGHGCDLSNGATPRFQFFLVMIVKETTKTFEICLNSMQNKKEEGI